MVRRYGRQSYHGQLHHVLRVNVLDDGSPIEVDELPQKVPLQIHHPGNLRLRQPGTSRGVSCCLNQQFGQRIAVRLVPCGEDDEGPLLIPIAVERDAPTTMWLPMGCDFGLVTDDRAPTAKMPGIP